MFARRAARGAIREGSDGRPAPPLRSPQNRPGRGTGIQPVEFLHGFSGRSYVQNVDLFFQRLHIGGDIIGRSAGHARRRLHLAFAFDDDLLYFGRAHRLYFS